MRKLKLSKSLGAAALAISLLPAGSSQAALVAYYPLDGNFNDVVGGFDGTGVNAPTFVAGNNGQAVELNGTNQFASLTSGANLQLGGNFTVSAFANFDVLGGPPNGDRPILGNLGPHGTSQTLHLVARGNGAHLGFFSNDTGSSNNLTTNTWTHIAWQFESGTQRIFVNGTQVASTGGHAAFAGTAKDVLLGQWNDDRFMDGKIDDVAVYNHVLNAVEVSHLAAGGSATKLQKTITWDFGDTPSLQGWTVLSGGAFFRPDEGGGITAANGGGGFAHDPAHTNFLVESPTFRLALASDSAIVIQADFRGGQGDQNGNIGNYDTPSDVINYNGGITNTLGVKAVGILDIASGQYIGFLLDPGNADGNGTLASLTAAQLKAMGASTQREYRLHFFDTDQGGWGWTQLNSIVLAQGSVPEPATLSLLGLAGLGLLGRRRRIA